MPSSSRAVAEEWEATTVTVSEAAVTTRIGAARAAPLSVVSGYSKDTSTTSELAMVVSSKSKDLVEIVKELDEYFLRAADAGAHLSSLLEVPTCGFPDQRSPGSLLPNIYTHLCACVSLCYIGVSAAARAAVECSKTCFYFLNNQCS